MRDGENNYEETTEQVVRMSPLRSSDISRESELSYHQRMSASAGAPRSSMLKIPVIVRVVLGSTRMSLAELMQLEPGAILTLRQKLSDPVSLEINGQEVAKGTIVIVNETTGQLGISLTQVAAETQS